MKHIIILFIIVIFIIISNNLRAQINAGKCVLDTSKTYVIKIKGNDEFEGRFISKDNDSLNIKSIYNVIIKLSLKRIRSIEEVEPVSDKHVRWLLPVSNAARYIIAPSAINLKAGEGYFQTAYIGVLNTFNIGITDYFSLSAGFSPMTSFDDDVTAYIMPKVGFKVVDKLYLGGGVLITGLNDGLYKDYYTSYGFNKKDIKLLFVNASYGTTDNNISIATGFSINTNLYKRMPYFSISGMIRLGKSVSFVSENWFTPSEKTYEYNDSVKLFPVKNYLNIFKSYYTYILANGFRFFWKRWEFDVDYLYNPELFEYGNGLFPYFNLIYKF